MIGLDRPCATCGDVIDAGTRCTQCKADRAYQRDKTRDRLTFRQNGYDSVWDRLSKRARTLQPFCSDCGTPHDLSADHLPSAWLRHEQGLAIRLQDVDVVCSPCNSKRGSSRPGTERALTA